MATVTNSLSVIALAKEGDVIMKLVPPNVLAAPLPGVAIPDPRVRLPTVRLLSDVVAKREVEVAPVRGLKSHPASSAAEPDCVAAARTEKANAASDVDVSFIFFCF
jgi:hypothetical protein